MDILLGLLLLLILVLGFLFWLWMLVDCVTKESSQGNDKLVWVLVIVLTNIIGAVIYFVVRRPQRFAELRR